MPVTATASCGAGIFQRAFRHGAATGSDTAPCCAQQLGRHAQQIFLGFVGIGDEAAFDHIGRAGNLGEQRRDQSAGAAFGGDDMHALGARRGQQRPAPRTRSAVGEHQISRKYCTRGRDDRRRQARQHVVGHHAHAAAAVFPPPRSARASRCRTGGTAERPEREVRAADSRREARRTAQASHWPANSSITHSDGSSRPVSRTWSPQAQTPIGKGDQAGDQHGHAAAMHARSGSPAARRWCSSPCPRRTGK